MAGSRTIHELRALVSSNVQSFVSGLARGEKATRSLRDAWLDAARAVDTAATRIATSVGGMVAATSAAVTKLGFDFLGMKEQAETSFTTLLGDGDKARKMFADLVELASKTPLQIRGAVGSAQKLLAMGFAPDKLLTTLRTIIDTVSALGGSEEVLGRVTTAFGQMLAKGKVSAEEMMQLAEAGIPAWKMLAETIGTDIPTAMKLVEQRAVDSETAISGLLQRMDQKFGGMAEKQSRTFQGLWSTIKDLALVGSAAIVEPLFVVVKRQLDRLAVYLQGAGFRQFAVGLRGQLLQVIAALEINTARPEQLFRRLGAVIGEFAKGAVSIIAWLKEAAPGLTQFGRTMWGIVQPIAEFLVQHPQFVAAWAALKIGQIFGISQAFWAVGTAVAATALRLLNLTAAVTGHTTGLRLLKSVLLADVTRPLQALASTVLPAVAAAWRRAGADARAATVDQAASSSAGFAATAARYAESVQIMEAAWAEYHAAKTRANRGFLEQTMSMQPAIAGYLAAAQNVRLLGQSVNWTYAQMERGFRMFRDIVVATDQWGGAIGQAALPALTDLRSNVIDVTDFVVKESQAIGGSVHVKRTAADVNRILAGSMSGGLIPSLQSAATWLRNVVTNGGAQFLRFLREVGSSALSTFLSGLRSLGPALGQLATQLATSARGMMTLGNAVRGLGWAAAIAAVLGYVNALNELKKAQVAVNSALAERDVLMRKQQRQEQDVRGRVTGGLQGIDNPADRYTAIREALGKAQREAEDKAAAAEEARRKATAAEDASHTIYDTLQRGFGVDTSYKYSTEKKNAEDMTAAAESAADFVQQLKAVLDQASRELEKAGKEQSAPPPVDLVEQQQREREAKEAAKEAERERERAAEDARRDAERRAERVEGDQYRLRGDLGFALEDKTLNQAQADQFATQMLRLGEAFKAGTISENEYEYQLRLLNHAIDETTQAAERAARAEQERAQAITDARTQFDQTIAQARAQLPDGNLPAFTNLQNRFQALTEQLRSGSISLDQFRNETALLTAEIDKATAAERRAMMLRLLQGKGTQADYAALQQMQQAAWLANFDQQLEATFNQMFGLGQAAQSVGAQFLNVNNGLQQFGQSLNGFVGGFGGSGGPGGSEFWGGLNDLFNSTQGQIDLLYNNIQLLYQSLPYKDDAERWKVLEQIRDLEQQLVDLQTSPPPTFVGQSADSFFQDPGLQTQTNNLTVNLPGIDRLDDNGIRHLADRLEEEFGRRGRGF